MMVESFNSSKDDEGISIQSQHESRKIDFISSQLTSTSNSANEINVKEVEGSLSDKSDEKGSDRSLGLKSVSLPQSSQTQNSTKISSDKYGGPIIFSTGFLFDKRKVDVLKKGMNL